MQRALLSEKYNGLKACPPDRSPIPPDERDIAIRCVEDAIRFSAMLTPQLPALFKENVPAVQIQAFLFYSWEAWFYLQSLMQIRRQNEGENFLDAFPLGVLKAVEAQVYSLEGVMMTRLKELTDFQDDFELYSMPQVSGFYLKSPFLANVVQDGDGYLAKCFEVPQVYGYGDTCEEAKKNLELELSSIYGDLLEDDNFSEEFLMLKAMLERAVDREK